MESASIRSVLPEAALSREAVRRVAANRQRGSGDQRFSDEFQREAQPSGRQERDQTNPGPAHHEDLPVAPPEDGEAGTHIDLVG